MRDEELTDIVLSIDPDQEWEPHEGGYTQAPGIGAHAEEIEFYYNEDAYRELALSMGYYRTDEYVIDVDLNLNFNDITIMLDLDYPFHESETHDWMKEGF